MHKITLQSFSGFLFWLLIMFTTVLMLIELAPKQGGWPYWDKVQHATIFAVLTSLAVFAYRQLIIGLCVGLAAYGALIECLQSMITITRTASVGDWLADVAGIAIGLLLWLMLNKLMLVKNISAIFKG